MDKIPEILLVEDDEVDATLISKSFGHLKDPVNLHWVKDGSACIDFLQRGENYESAPPPDLILLDINLPRMNGREVLQKIWENESLRRLPVVVITSSASDLDVHDMYQLRCNTYIIKPNSTDAYRDMVQKLYDYWFKVVLLPPTS